MIVKEWNEKLSTDKRIRAGQKAEKQMAYYLKREFGKDNSIFVFNDLRLVDDEVAQIDHLVVHPYGFVLVESKSVTGKVEINEYEEWTRNYQGKSEGMGSPLNQLDRQKKFLVELLNGHAPELLGKLLGIQKRFGGRQYDCIVAISDRAEIDRKKDVEGVYKADAVAGLIRARIRQYKKELISGDVVWFNNKELNNIRDFLIKRHCPRNANGSLPDRVGGERLGKEVVAPGTSEGRTAPPFVCDKCSGTFEIRYGYSFYLYCPTCKRKPIALHPKCPVCEYDAELEHETGTRIIQYRCKNEPSHSGIFHRNKEIYQKDEK